MYLFVCVKGIGPCCRKEKNNKDLDQEYGWIPSESNLLQDMKTWIVFATFHKMTFYIPFSTL